MKKLIYFFLCTLIVLPLTACNAKNNTLENNFKLIESTDEIKGTLNISIHKWPEVTPFLVRMADSFKDTYPDAEVILNTTETIDSYAQKISTQLMSGTADDLIDFTGINYYSGIDNGYFVNYYDLFQNDTNFNIDEYYKNVFDAFTYKDGLYAFPINFAYRLIGINAQLPTGTIENFNKNGGVNLLEALNIYINAENEDNLYVEKGFSLYNLVINSINKYVDYENKTCNFNNDEFIRILKDSKNVAEPRREYFWGRNSYSFFVPDDLTELSKKYMFLEADCSNVQIFLPPYESESFNDFIPLLNINGKLNITSDNAFMMNRKSENKALAWEFIKFVSSDKNTAENESFRFLTPVSIKKDVFEMQYTSHLYSISQYLGQHGVYLKSETEIEDTLEKIKLLNEMPMEFANWYPDLSIIVEELTPFIQEVITAEQAAANLQNKISLKLNE